MAGSEVKRRLFIKTKRTSRPDRLRPRSNISNQARDFAVACARLADQKKADDIVVLDLKKQDFIVDYFVICSVRNKKQAQAIADELARQTNSAADKKKGRPSPAPRLAQGMEGYETGSWILLDFGDVIVHIFHEPLRKFYDLEFLWSDAPRIKWL